MRGLRAQTGVVSFSSDAELLSSLTSDRDALYTGIRQMRAVGATHISAALEMANDALSAASNGRRNLIWLLSDGIQSDTYGGDGGVPTASLGGEVTEGGA